MLEPVLAHYLNLYLGKYVKGLDTNSLRISVWKGDVVLENLQLRPEALEELKLPITVKAGLLGTLRLKIPWAALGTQQVQVEIDRLYVLAVPNYFQDSAPPADASAEEERLQKKKDEEIAAAERRWVETMEAAQHKQSVASQPGYVQGLVNVVLGNLKLKITNFHIRYEDSVTRPGSPFACGLTLQNIGAATIDETGKEIFVKKGALELLRKLAQLSRFALYFDTEISTLWHSTQDFADLAIENWDEFFLPGISSDEGAASGRQYVLNPVDGDARYVRRAAELVTDRDTPFQFVTSHWPDFALKVSQTQATNVTLLLQELSRHQLRMPYASFRPDTRPTGGAAPLWWRYAFRAVHQQLRQGRLSWWAMSRCLKIQREYVPLYVDKLEQADKTITLSDPSSDLVELERELPTDVILHFRKLAHARVRRRKRKADKKEAAGQQRTWASWLGFGRGKNEEAEEEGGAEESLDEDEERAYLTSGEIQQLEDLVREQASAFESSDPLQVLSRGSLSVARTSIELCDASGTVAVLSSTDLHLNATTFQTSMSVAMSLGAAGLSTPACDIIRTGALSGSELRFLQLDYVMKPEDAADVDHSVHMRMAPAYVTYEAEAVERLTGFFTVETDEELDLSALGAQATTHIQEMQAIAQQQVQAAWINRPKVDVFLDLQAPKVAVPVPTSTPSTPLTLLLDLGQLVISSNFDERETLGVEETAIYECYSLLSSDLAAYLINGEFAWPKTASSAGAAPSGGISGGLETPTAAMSGYLATGKGSLIPLLGHCSTSASVHMATVAHPTLPMIRVGLQVPHVALHVSPARLSQLMLVMRTVMPTSTAPADPAPWVRAAEYTSTVDVLSWQGFAATTGQWQSRFAVVYRGTLYLMEHEGSAVIMRQVALWQGRRVVPLPEHMTGAPHVLAVTPAHLSRERTLEEPSAIIMRLESDYMLQEWTRRLRHSAAQMRTVATLYQVQDDVSLQLDASSTTTSQPVPSEVTVSEAPPSLGAMSRPSSTADIPGRVASDGDQPQSVSAPTLRASAHLGRLSLHVSARTAEQFWPPSDVAPAPARGLSANETSLGPAGLLMSEIDVQSGDEAMMGDERPLILIVAEGGLLNFTQSLGHQAMNLHLQRFVIEDRLVGPINRKMRYLSRSFAITQDDEAADQMHDATSAGAPLSSAEVSVAAPRTPSLKPSQRQRSAAAPSGEDTDDDDMVSACSDMLSGALSGSVVPVSHPADPRAAAKEAMAQRVLPYSQVETQVRSCNDSLVSITFHMWDSATAPDYDNVDMDLDITVSTLYFACNRPTVAALMCFSQDLDTHSDAAPSTNVATAAAEAVGAAPGSVAARSGGEERTLLRFGFAVKRLQAEFVYEGYNLPPLALGSMLDLKMDVHMHPKSMIVNATLGNLEAEDCALTEDSPYRLCLGLRHDQNTSLIETCFRTHSEEESYDNARVPDGVRFCSLEASMQAVTVVFLNRFLNESLAYLSGLFYFCPKTPPPASTAFPSDALDAPSTSAASAKHAPIVDARKSMHQRDTSGTASRLSRPSVGTASREKAQSFRTQLTERLGMAVLLDVQMAAPVIEMPRHSASQDSLEMDLGHLTLTNRVIAREVEKGLQVVDVMDLQLQDISAKVLSGESQGQNLLRQVDKGLSLHITRSLVDDTGSLPTYNCHVDVPHVLAVVTDEEYSFCTAVSGANLAEPMRMPVSALWLQDRITAAPLAESSGPASSELDTAAAAAPAAAASTIRATLAFDSLELELRNAKEHEPGVSTPLSKLLCSKLFINYISDAPRHMDVRMCLPTLLAHDLRPERLSESSLVLSSSMQQTSSPSALQRPEASLQGASMLTLRYLFNPDDGSSEMVMRLQRPTFVAEMDFMVAMLSFAAPSLSLGGEPAPFIQRDTHLVEDVTVAEDHLWLSPEHRLLADAPFLTEATYDANGFCIVLPPDLPPTLDLPLIVIGPDVKLRIKNAAIHNSASLASCLSLAPGAKLIISNDDNVTVYDKPPHHLRDPVASLEKVAERVHGAFVKPVARDMTAKSAKFQVELAAIGVGLHVIASKPMSPGNVKTATAGQKDAPLLAVYTDVQATYAAQEDKENANLCLKGLRMETQILTRATGTSNEASSAAALEAATHYHGGVVRQGAGITQGRVLDALDVVAAYDARKREVIVEVSDIALHVSPDVLTVISEVQDTVLRPVQAAAPAAPLAAVNAYTLVATSHEKNSIDPPYSAVGAGGLDAFGGEKGFSFWAPRPPPGHAPLGHVLTAGASQPMYEVVCVALTSAIVAWPLRFTRVWNGGSASVWRADPPPGFVALGCIATSGDEPPAATAMACVHEEAVTVAPLGECLARSGDGCLWAVDNCGGCFIMTEEADKMPQVTCYDLRSPMGTPPPRQPHSYELPEAPGNDPASQTDAAYSSGNTLTCFRSHQHFVEAWDESLKSARTAALISETVAFERIWTNRSSASSRANAVSIWRPVAFQNYVSLGDCLVVGSWQAPRSVVLLRSSVSPGEEKLVASATQFTKVWSEGSERAALTLWDPVAPEGFVAVGLAATLGSQPPPSFTVYCVRADATRMAGPIPGNVVDVSSAQAPGLSENLTQPQVDAVHLCVFDEHTHALQLRRVGRTTKPAAVLKLSAIKGSGVEAGWARVKQLTKVGEPVPYKMHFNCASISVAVRDLLRVPLLELESARLLADATMAPDGSASASLNFGADMWSYNAPLKAWEPILEHVNVQTRYNYEAKQRSTEGASDSGEAGTTLEVAIKETLNVTLSHAAMDASLRALAAWRSATAPDAERDALYRHAAAADLAFVLTEVANLTGEPLKMWMDFGSSRKVAELALGSQRLRQPLVRPVKRNSGSHASKLPAMLLSVTLHKLKTAGLTDGTTRELFLAVSLTSAQASHRAAVDIGVHTRCIRVEPDHDGPATVEETFLMELPENIAKAFVRAVQAVVAPRSQASERGSYNLGDSGALHATGVDAAEPPPLGIRVQLHDQTTPTDEPLAVGVWDASMVKARDAAVEVARTRAAKLPLPGTPEVELFAPGKSGSGPSRASIDLTVSLQRLQYWLDAPGGMGSTGREASRCGCRSLALAGPDASWQSIMREGAQATLHPTSGVSGSVLGLNIRSGVALVETFEAGVRRETIRSTVVVKNDLDFPVQVSVKLPPGVGGQSLRGSLGGALSTRLSSGSIVHRNGAEALAHSASLGRHIAVNEASDAPAAASSQVLEEEVFENERFLPFKGFKPENLMPLDPRRYSQRRNGGGSSKRFPYMAPPAQWEWQGPWKVETTSNTDSDGWSYAVDFAMLSYPFHNGSSTRSMAHFVRRRRWVRQRRKVSGHGSAARTSTPRASADIDVAMPQRPAAPERDVVVLGVIERNSQLPVPLRLLEVSADLRIRPCLPAGHAGVSADDSKADDDAPLEACHAWSSGASNGVHGVVLNADTLGDTDTRLLQCNLMPDAEIVERTPDATFSALTQPEDRTFSAADLRRNVAYISLAVDASVLHNAGPTEIDWLITLSPPLRINSLLPVPSDYTMYEIPRGSSSYVARETGTVEAGGTIAVYDADVRRRISFKLVPRGYEWTSPGAVELSAGYASHAAGVSGPQTLPTSFPLTNANTQAPLLVRVERELAMSGGVEAPTGGGRSEGGESSSSTSPPAGEPSPTPAPMRDPGAEIAMGCSMLVRVYVPVWVLNQTQLPVAVALVERTGESVAAARRLAYTESAESVQQAAAARASTPGGMHNLPVIHCSVNNPARPPPAPGGGKQSHCRVMPGSCELLSHAPIAGDSAQVMLHLNVLGAPWSPAIVIDGPTTTQPDAQLTRGRGKGRTANSIAAAAENLRLGRPVLFRAHVPETGIALDVVAHLQVAPAPFQRCKVLHLTPHIVFTNRTGTPLALRFAGGSKSATSSRGPSPPPSGSERRIMLTAQSHGELLSASPVPQLTTVEDEKLLPSGAVGLPLNFPTVSSRSFCLALPTEPGATSADLPWSQPLHVEYPGTPELCMTMPVNTAWFAANSSAFKPQQPPKAEQTDSPVAATPARLSKIQPEGSARCKSLLLRLEASEAELGTGDAVPHKDNLKMQVCLRMSMQVAAPGCLHIVAHSVGIAPPYLLQNRSAARFLYRQADTNEPWSILPPWSALGYAFTQLNVARKRLEVRLAVRDVQAVKVPLEDSGQGNMQQSGADVVTYKPGGHPHFLLHCRDVVDGIMSSTGISDISGPAGPAGRLGTTGLDRALVITQASESLPLDRGLQAPAVGSALSAPCPAMRMLLNVASVDVSIVDHTPEELLLCHVDAVKAEYSFRIGAAARFTRMALTVQHVQVDDQMWDSQLPVVMCTLLSKQKPQPPAVEFSMLYETSTASGRRRMPYLIVDMPRALQLCLSEALAWRVYSMASTLPQLAAAAPGPRAATPGAGPARTTTAATAGPQGDTLLSIGLLSICSVDGTLFFRACPAARPRSASPYVSMAALAMLPDVLDRVSVHFEGSEVQHISMRATQLANIVQQQLRSQIVSMGLSLLYSYIGYFGTGAFGQGLSAVSHSLKRIAGARSDPSAAPSSAVTSVSDGVGKGAGNFVKGIFRGVRGLVEQPLKGGIEGGAAGALKGIGHGIAGAVALPLAGAIDLGASTMQGVNASLTSVLQGGSDIVTARRRLQRALGHGGVLEPFDYSRALGQALLKVTLASPAGRRRNAQIFGVSQDEHAQASKRAAALAGADLLEDFFVLQGGNVLLMTSIGMLLTQAPEFVEYVRALWQGRTANVSTLTPGKVVWSLAWRDVLAPELRGLRDREPVHVTLHRRFAAPPLDVKCESNRQAVQLRHTVEGHIEALQQARSLAVNRDGPEDQERPDLSQGQALPLKMPNMEWRLVCMVPTSSLAVPFSIWRPVGAQGYASLGDVLRRGREPPQQPVTMYLHSGGEAVLLEDAGSSEEEAEEGALGAQMDAARNRDMGTMPLFVQPVHYRLIWREFSQGGMTLWRAREPEGYVALGNVASRGLDQPPFSAMVCVRRDLVNAVGVQGSPILRCTSTDDMQWPLSAWQVNSRSGSFLAYRSHKAPAPGDVFDVELPDRVLT